MSDQIKHDWLLQKPTAAIVQAERMIVERMNDEFAKHPFREKENQIESVRKGRRQKTEHPKKIG